MKNVWIADDGQVYNTMEECAKHERNNLKKVIVNWLNCRTSGVPDFLFISEDSIPFISHLTNEIADKMIPTLESYAKVNLDNNCNTPYKLFWWCVNIDSSDGFGDMFQIFYYDDEADAFLNVLPRD